MTDHDVVVVGGGPGGFGAAVAAGRSGRDVALVEPSEILGGVGTTGLVTSFANAYWDGERFIIGGIFEELRYRLVGNKRFYQTKGPHHREKFDFEPFEPDACATEMEIMCREADVDLLLGRYVTGAATDDGAVTALELDDGSTVSTDVVVDATGDAVVAHETGVPTTFGREADDWVQPLTYCYIVGPVDFEELKRELPHAVMYDENTGDEFSSLANVEEVQEMVDEALAAGELDINVTQVSTLRSVPGEPRNFAVNFGHVEVDDPTDEAKLADATEEGRRQMRVAVEFFRNYLPGFGDVEVVREPEKIGVRQSRQIEGLYELTEDDVLDQRQFDDAIAQCRFPVDIHKAGEERGWVELPPGTHYDVPLRTLVPREGPENLVVAGRCLSADHVAMSTIRQMASVMALGEAAGVTAALAVETGSRVRDVDADDVQDVLRTRGAILE